VCAECIRTRRDESLPRAAAVHERARRDYRLPEAPPRATDGARCPLCAHECRIAEGQRGYCGLRTSRQGRLVHLAGVPQRGLLEWYRDPLSETLIIGKSHAQEVVVKVKKN